KQPVIIALSASGRGDVNLKMKRAGIKAYVPKPFDPKELQEVIIHFLSENNGSIQQKLQPPSTPNSVEEFELPPVSENKSGSIDLSNMLRLAKNDPGVMMKLVENSLKSLKKYREEFKAAAKAKEGAELE